MSVNLCVEYEYVIRNIIRGNEAQIMQHNVNVNFTEAGS